MAIEKSEAAVTWVELNLGRALHDLHGRAVSSSPGEKLGPRARGPLCPALPVQNGSSLTYGE